jgi:V/A-type H+-transporting ATPase subunit D
MLNIPQNKSGLQLLERQIKIRLQALPALKMRETALRQVAIQLKKEWQAEQSVLDELQQEISHLQPMFAEWQADRLPSFCLETKKEKRAGLQITLPAEIIEGELVEGFIPAPIWLKQAIPSLSSYRQHQAKAGLLQKALQEVNEARRKNSRKVNLFEKVQIPRLEEQARLIKRTLADVEALQVAAQKISRNRRLQEGPQP